MVNQFNARRLIDKGEDLKQRNEQQGIRYEIGQKDACGQRGRPPKLHPRQRERSRDTDQHRDNDNNHSNHARVSEKRQVIT